MYPLKLSNFLFIFFCLLWVLPAANAQLKILKKKKNEADLILKSEVLWNYAIIDNTPDHKGFKASETNYFPNGKKKEWICYRSDGTIKYQYFYEYDDVKRAVVRYWKHEGEIINDYREEYDALGNIIKLLRYKPNGDILDISMYDYDSKGRKASETYYNDENKRVFQIKYTYNESQKSMTEKHIDLLNDTEFIAAIELDAQGNHLTKTRYEKSGPLVDKIIYKRDEAGNLMEKQFYPDGKKIKLKEIYKYDPSGKKMSCSVIDVGNDKLLEFSVYVYEFYQP